MNEQGVETAGRTIAHHSKSFSLASSLLPRGYREEVWVLYHWCRRADDMIDGSEPAMHGRLIDHLRRELDEIYGGAAMADPALSAFQSVTRTRGVPRYYADELLAGMEMDSRKFVYRTEDELLLYCYRVAGTVGLMMCHVLGVREAASLRQAADLGVAMQLTNICRDVREDWERGRIYLPMASVEGHGGHGLEEHLGETLPAEYGPALSRTVRDVLDMADRYYRQADAGMTALPWQGALAVRTARLVYAAIAGALQAQAYDVFAPRAYVSGRGKALRAAAAAGYTVAELPYRLRRPFRRAPLTDAVLTHEAYLAGRAPGADGDSPVREAGLDG